MKIGIIDADLIGRQKHRFPNLACEKIAGFYKEQGHEVKLLNSYDDIDLQDKVFISKVFTDTPYPDWIKNNDKVSIGGTGFYFDQAPPLPNEIEHHMPDYHLYDDWIETQISKGVSASQFKDYKDCAIGFLTRGCFRKCKFCVNQKYDHVSIHSPIDEFYDGTQKRICLLDDNFFGCGQWKQLLQRLISINKPFRFKQGLDERLLTEEKCQILFNCKYDGRFTFAFDSVKDYDIIENKLKLINKYIGRKRAVFYVLVGFEGTDAKDIENAFIRISLLAKYNCYPYIMRYQAENNIPYKTSKYAGLYTQLASWCNQPQFFKKKTFREFCEARQKVIKSSNKISASLKALQIFEKDNPEIAQKYFDVHFMH